MYFQKSCSFQDLHSGLSKKGNLYNILSVADPKDYSAVNFFVTDEIKDQVEGLSRGDFCELTVDVISYGASNRVNVVEVRFDV